MTDPATDSAAPFGVARHGPWTVVTFQTEQLMESTALERIAKALYPVVDEQGRRHVVLDFAAVKYLSSQAIGILLTMHKKIAALPHGQLILCGVDAKLMQLLKITRLDRLLKIVPGQAEALATPVA